MEYEKLLEDAYSKIKPIKAENGRFEIPKVTGQVEGKKTIITNFLQIASYLRRKPEHLEKYLQRELAASSHIDEGRLILNRKLSSAAMNEKINNYVEEFVICKECGKPDTELIKQDRLYFLHCLACGAKHSVRSKI